MKKILILSRSDDEHVERLTDELEKLGHQWVCFDPGEFPEQVNLYARLGERINTIELTCFDGKQILLEEIGSIWYRRPTPLQADTHLPIMQQIFIEREARAGLWGILRSIDGIWVNHPDAIRESAYKPRQLTLTQSLGLNIPRTLITNQPDIFKRFYEECQGNVIYKLLGFPYYEVEGGAAASTFTSLVSEELLKDAYRVKATAHLFQQYHSKICDLRVIIIGERLFTVEIHPLSEETRIDFRRDYRALRYEVHCLPQEIEQALFSMTYTYRLHYAAIDLLYTTEKQYLFLELNPVGQLGWLEEPTGLPLFRSLAHFLTRGL